MAERSDTTDGIKFLSEVFFDAEGNEVDDPKKAATGYVTMQHPDGTIEHATVVNTKNYTGEMPPPKTVTAPPRRRAIKRSRPAA